MVNRVDEIKKCSECGCVTGYEGENTDIKYIMQVFENHQEVEYAVESRSDYDENRRRNQDAFFKRNRLIGAFCKKNVAPKLRHITKEEYINIFE